MTIYFDMDGTIANLYAVENWLPKLRNEDASPYLEAEPLLKLSALARKLNQLQRKGYELGIVSWTAKNGTASYNEKVRKAKLEWLKVHLKSVHFNEIHIIEYGTPKSTVMKNTDDILFDDEEPNRKEWKGTAYDVHNIMEVLKEVA